MDCTFLLYEGFSATDIVGPADVFQVSNEWSKKTHYRLRYVGLTETITASNGMVFKCRPLGEEAPGDVSMLMIPGAGRTPLKACLQEPAIVAWIKAVWETAERVCSVCSGAFLLAETGLLDGRSATTHWRGMKPFARAYPRVKLQEDVLYVQDQELWTSAGVTAGIDMALAIVEGDLGRPLALAVAREMVLFLVRPGGQSQYSAPLDLQHTAADTELHQLPFWLEERLSESVSVADMAEAMSMSERHFHRRCKVVFDLTPNALYHQLRLKRARLLLEDGGLSLKHIASETGFHDSSALGKAFRERYQVTPGEYRSHFGVP